MNSTQKEEILYRLNKLYDIVFNTEQNNKDQELQFGFNIMYLLIDDIRDIMVV